MKKKAEIGTSMIIGLILVVATIVILGLAFYQLNMGGEEIDREACRTSAIFRSTLPEIGTGQLKEMISLNCKTKKICVTTNKIKKGECENEFGTTEGKYSSYRVDSDKTKAEQQIKMLLAREMAECWEMLGRGNLVIFKRTFESENIGSVGVICSRVHFDETITGNKKGQLDLKELGGMNQYLLTHKVPNNDISYWDFLRNAYDGETANLIYGPQMLTKEGENALDEFQNTKLDLTITKAIMMVEIRSTARGAFFGGAIGTGAGLIGAVASKGTLAGPMIIGGGILGWNIGDKFQLWMNKKKGINIDGSEAVSSIFLIDYTSEGFERFSGSGESFEIASYA